MKILIIREFERDREKEKILIFRNIFQLERSVMVDKTIDLNPRYIWHLSEMEGSDRTAKGRSSPRLFQIQVITLTSKMFCLISEENSSSPFCRKLIFDPYLWIYANHVSPVKIILSLHEMKDVHFQSRCAKFALLGDKPRSVIRLFFPIDYVSLWHYSIYIFPLFSFFLKDIISLIFF